MPVDTAYVQFHGVSIYSQSAPIRSAKTTDETHEEHEARTWRERMHVAEKGFVQIPPMVFKNSLTTASQHLGLKIPGKRGAQYTKRFERGIMVLDPVILNIKAEDVEGEALFVPADGVRGGSSRVWKTFPMIPPGRWGGIVKVSILDLIITRPVFAATFEALGMFIGIGRFRPERNGYYGRLEVEKIVWDPVDDPRKKRNLEKDLELEEELEEENEKS